MIFRKSAKSARKEPDQEVLEELRGQLELLDGLLPNVVKVRTAEKVESIQGLDTSEISSGEVSDRESEEDFESENFEFYEEEVETESIESEELETAVDGILSDMAIHLGRKKEPKTLEELFEKLFGSKSRSVRMAARLEDAINGYLGHVFGKDLASARENIRLLIKFIDQRIEKCKM